MQLFIPQLGDRLTLTKPWTFSLFFERRNNTFVQAAGLIKFFLENGKPITVLPYSSLWVEPYTYKGKAITKNPVDVVTLPAETVLGVERIYIRKGGSEYNSLSFNLIKGSTKTITTEDGATETLTHKGRVRFWAKLIDVNTMEIAG